MEKAYEHLVTTLALYGSCYSGGIKKDKSINSGCMEDTSLASIEVHEGQQAKKDGKNIRERKILVANSVNKRVRRPRKSAIQNRKIDFVYTDSYLERDDSDLDDVKIEESNSKKQKNDVYKVEASKPITITDAENKFGDKDEDDIIEAKENKNRKLNESIENDNNILSLKKNDLGKLEENEVLFSNRVSLKDSISEFPCKNCSYVAAKQSKLRTHMLHMHLSTPSSCDICKKVYPNHRYMLRHRATHGGPQHCCDICGKMYKIRKAMLNHRKTHDSNYKKPSVQCRECPKSFCSQYILDCHVRDIHQGLKKSFLCSICGKNFTTKHSLTEHINAHSGIKPYSCDICDKSFSYESALRDHKLSHKETKSFWCKHCQKGFTQRSGLKMHMRTHKLNKSFVCSECGRGFTQKQALQRHERVHKGEKPFICKHCGSFFTDASIIRRHLMLVHKVHKSVSTWREDIICTIKANTDCHVHKIGEEDKVKSQEENNIQEFVLEKNKTRVLKRPSRAFKRTYPRKVVILDDDGNVIAPLETEDEFQISKSKLEEKTTIDSSSIQIKQFQPPSPFGTSIILSNDTNGNLDTNQVMNTRYLDILTSHISKEAGPHIESIVLEDSVQNDLQKSLDQGHILPRIIKYEPMHNGTIDSSAGQVSFLSPGAEYQTSRSPPVSFSASSTLQSRVIEPQFESLTTHIAQLGGQFLDGRSGNSSNHQWPPMYLYTTQLPSLGLSLSSDYSLVNQVSVHSTQSSSQLIGPYVSHSSSDDHSAGEMTTLIINKPLSMQEREADSQNFASSLDVNNEAAAQSSSMILPQPNSILSGQQVQTISMDTMSMDDSLTPTEIILQQEQFKLDDDKDVADNIALISTGDKNSCDLSLKGK